MVNRDYSQIRTDFDKDVKNINNLDELQKTHTKYLGKRGIINSTIKQIPQNKKAEFGSQINKIKKYIQNNLNQLKSNIINKNTEQIDITIPGIKPATGYLHLISEAISEIEEIFKALGFVRRRYPEIDTDWYYAEGLNIPKGHPARDNQETFYVTDNIVLTAHTSNGQLREMEALKTPPIKMINIGKCYRREASNTHSPMFHQFEGLVIDKNINISHLIGTTNYFFSHYFGKDRIGRFRPHHFQFTEPSFEVDINCHICKGTGKNKFGKCKSCKAGWLELGGAGMVHPQVLKNGNIDPNKYTGFAFGWGIERIIMMKHQITDNLRDLYSSDLRFLQQI
jgi:phenylalanyl-tRNA synthetase alpha chain